MIGTGAELTSPVSGASTGRGGVNLATRARTLRCVGPGPLRAGTAELALMSKGPGGAVSTALLSTKKALHGPFVPLEA